MSAAAKPEATIGVGDGPGQLFVHGSHEAVKRVQSIILEAERLQAEVARLSPSDEETRYTADQDWTGLDGMTAYWLIDRHGDGWAGIGAMMEAWRDAEVQRITAELRRERDELSEQVAFTARHLAIISGVLGSPEPIEIDDIAARLHLLIAERNALAARLAEIERAEPVAVEARGDGRIVELIARPEPVAALRPPAAELMAWAHPDGRVIPASTMQAARRDGGAMLSSVREYKIALGPIGHPPAAEPVRQEPTDEQIASEAAE